ncbi:DUF1266 domain-containing protein [Streptomyces griseorubiginosus]|uniref:DUF1266 domain-containing protein n=1 Tax=Streptomyces griseorubiginosus TaxID=67304 RepID=UPI003658F32E
MMSFGPPPAGFEHPAPPAWTPPTDIEQELLDAKSREDWSAYFDALAQSRVYFEIRRDLVDARAGDIRPVFEFDPRVAGGRVWAVHTEGMLPAPEPHRVFDWNSLAWFAKVWDPTDPPMIVVNPRSPCEAFLPSAPPQSHAWGRFTDRKQGPADEIALRALRVGGPLHGPVAHGLACGAHLIVRQGMPWNALAYHGQGYPAEREMLRTSWGVANRQQWLEQQQALLATDGASPVWEFALSLRRTIARDFGGYVETGYWRDAAARVLRQKAEGETVLSSDGVTTTTPLPAADTEARVKGVQHLIGRITRYEARMRADGILDEGQYVSSVDAWDLGRASCMARWGLSTRYCALPEAEAAVVEAGYRATRCYDSWQDFSAAFILGRCLQFDNEKFGNWYQDMVTVHGILSSDSGSPWLNIPFR